MRRRRRGEKRGVGWCNVKGGEEEEERGEWAGGM